MRYTQPLMFCNTEGVTTAVFLLCSLQHQALNSVEFSGVVYFLSGKEQEVLPCYFEQLSIFLN